MNHWPLWLGGGLVTALVLAWRASLASRPTPLVFSTAPEGFLPPASEAGCDPVAKPGVVRFGRWWMTRYGGSDLGILRACNIGGDSGHKLGRAWDWGVLDKSKPARVESGLAELLVNDAELFRRAGLLYVIYNRQIFTSHDAQWKPYSGPSAHVDHVHFSFGESGANARTTLFGVIP